MHLIGFHAACKYPCFRCGVLRASIALTEHEKSASFA
ncbi:DUF2752 domain-containing protein [Serratia ureilytica]|uniref:DUF2752 domain-containing protein n=1 Tax=Serratia ureilytica TaxID=300181 RepID=A0A9X9G1R9_9GAMM|nr:DUF2752 domain-containing protein [Serratia sp. LS-1]EMB2350278.1 DUF2752 domain-containing protein [Serratia marcescens]MBF4188614.1 DUF2752 domain-containing protein [Serratia ureilytica]MBF8440869.1 DUF2752 domain-containing protein [Serratia ureilytica]MBF8446518.1 DUF2752 domain-containing protein [Serratia ureilytica]